MLCANYLSDEVPYRTLEEAAAEGDGMWFPAGLRYNSDVLTGNQYECIDRLNGLFVSPDGGARTDSGTVIVTGWTAKAAWPGWGRLRWEFDVETGAFLRRGACPGGYHDYDVHQGAGGELWLGSLYGGVQRRLGPDYQPTGEIIDPQTYGAIFFGGILVDLQRDRLIVSFDVETHLRVLRYSTGEQLGFIWNGSHPVDLCHEDGSRCYVLCNDRTVHLLDYEAGRLLGATRLPDGPVLWNQGAVRIAWDKRYKRLLLVAAPTAKGWDYTTHITGYPIRPVPTHLCAPIPLEPMRAGRPFRTLIRAVGDRGEGVPGLVTLASNLAGPNTVGLDGNGEAVVQLVGAAEGLVALNLSLETPCLP